MCVGEIVKTDRTTRRGKEVQRRGVLASRHQRRTIYFDTQAQVLVSLSGKRALKLIKSGKAKSNLKWAKLALLSNLLDE